MGDAATVVEETKDEFADAFAEAPEADGQAAEAAAGGTADQEGAARAAASEGSAEDKAEGEGDGSAGAGAEQAGGTDKGGAAAAKATAGGAGKSSGDDEALEYDISKLTPEEVVEKLKLERQRRKSYDGQMRSTVEKAKAFEEENARLKAGLSQAAGEAAAGAGAGKDKGAEGGEKGEAASADWFADLKKEPEFADFLKEYDEVGPAILKVGQHIMERQAAVLKGIVQKIVERYDPMLKSVGQTALEKHLSAIRGQYADFDTWRDSGDLKAWIEGLPEYKKQAYLSVYEQGTTEETLDLLKDFASAKGYASGGKVAGAEAGDGGAGAEQPGGVKKPHSREAVKAKSGPIAAKAGGTQDFEGAFSEAPD